MFGGFLEVGFTPEGDQCSFPGADIIAPGLRCEAFGRWGNFFNRIIRSARRAPWKIFIEPARRLRIRGVEYYHPLFLYESIWNLLNMGFLIWAGRRFRNWLKNGDLFLLYAIFYAVGRFSLEFLRLDPSPVAGINVNQTLMAVIGIGATVILVARHRLIPAPEEEETPPRQEV